jgi:hypothetical protein
MAQGESGYVNAEVTLTYDGAYRGRRPRGLERGHHRDL